MMVSMETYLRKGTRQLQRWLLHPQVRTGMQAAALAGAGFFLSAASLGNRPQPLAMGYICAGTGWQTVVMTLGSVLGYGVFWGSAGLQGMVWSVLAMAAALLLGSRVHQEEPAMVLCALASFLVSAAGLVFQAVWQDATPIGAYLLRIGLAGSSAWLFLRATRKRNAITDWVLCGVGTLALAQTAPLPGWNLGYMAGGALAVSGAFPAAALAGLGLDLARISPIPMGAVLCGTYFFRLAPIRSKWLRCLSPALSGLLVMGLCGVWDPLSLPALALGGGLGLLLPKKPELNHRRGETGLAQVRLEMTADILCQMQQVLLEAAPLPIDESALAQKARSRACGSCSARNACREQETITAELLHHPLDFTCRKTGRIAAELRHSQDQLRILQADRQRQRQYRGAVLQQYQFLSEYLRGLADQLPRRGERILTHYRVEVSARSHAREMANGDRCMAFSGGGYRYYVLLCDGMGTGLGAAQEGQSTGELLRKMLCAGFPPDHALRSINAILALRGQAGAVTVDLAEIRLDTGQTRLYKWGAVPSWVLRKTGAEKIGTATPPPGISVTEGRETVTRLSLGRGEVLILLSDGVEVGDALRRNGTAPDAPPGELAEKLLEWSQNQQDDATAVVIRLHRNGSRLY